MSPSQRIAITSLVAVLGLVSHSRSQGDTDAWRSRSATVLPTRSIPGLLGVTRNFTTSPAVLQWLDRQDPPQVLAQKTLPFHRVGCLERIDRTSDRFLISGLEFVQWTPVVVRGVLCKVQLSSSPAGIQILETKTYPTVDPAVVRWNEAESRIYAADPRNKTLLAASWTGWSAPLPDAFTTVATKATVAQLANTWGYRLAAAPEAGGAYFHNGTDTSTVHWIREVAGAWQASTVENTNDLLVRHPVWVSLADSLEARLPAVSGGSWSIVRSIDGAVVASGQGPVEEWFAITPPADFSTYPGLEYALTAPSGAPTPYRFFLRPTVRYGSPVGATGFSLGRVSMPLVCQVGDDGYAHGVDVDTTIGTGTVQASLWVATRGPNGDPVTIQGNTAVLDPQATIDFSFDLATFGSTVGLRYPIPDDPTLEGVVLLWQYVFVLPNSEVAFTEVFGTGIVNESTSQTSRSNQNGWKTGQSSTKLARAWQLLGATKDGRLAPEKRERVAALRKRMLAR